MADMRSKGFVDGLNLYAFVLNDPLIKYDLYGLFSSSSAYDAGGAALHKAADFGAGSINFISDIGFGLSTPFLYGYRSFTGEVLQMITVCICTKKNNLRTDVQNLMQKIIPVNRKVRLIKHPAI